MPFITKTQVCRSDSTALCQLDDTCVRLAGGFHRSRAGDICSLQPRDGRCGLCSLHQIRQGERARSEAQFRGCLAYAVAAVMRAPLLFRHGDLGLTDVMAQRASIPISFEAPSRLLDTYSVGYVFGRMDFEWSEAKRIAFWKPAGSFSSTRRSCLTAGRPTRSRLSGVLRNGGSALRDEGDHG
jgi:hypothetical protein